MKTNQVMTRKMGDFGVIQRTKDGMFNATFLIKQWNESGLGAKKEMGDYFVNKQTQEYLKALENEEEFTNGNSPYVKSKASRGENAGTWMHPLLFIDFAMWLNPTFKVKVIKFVYDKMLEYRSENCEAYKELSTAVQSLVGADKMRKAMQKVAEALNWIVFGSHESMMRNKQGDESLQKELLDLEIKVANLINEGFINSYDDLLNYLRIQWRKKNTPVCLM